MIAFSSFFYGRALLLNGHHERALHQFEMPGACPPAVALCKEPSKEHVEYLRELLEAGIDLDVVDNTRYSTLDYAVFSGDEATQQVVLDFLQRKLGADAGGGVSRRMADSHLRKGYRELFQEKLRPVLLRAVDANAALSKLRCVYADALAATEDYRHLFDGLRVMSYSDFRTYGRLPRSNDGLDQVFQHNPHRNQEGRTPDFVIFISYTRINRSPNARTPDDANSTQYHRILRAIEQFLARHSFVDRDCLSIWVVSAPLINDICSFIVTTLMLPQDHACVDQDDPMRGVSALPMIIVQCDAMISLVDGTHYNRAWCSLEAMMIQTLKESYGLHLWYGHVPLNENTGEESTTGFLREGPMDVKLSSVAEKELSFEEDRPKLLFLERQSQLLR